MTAEILQINPAEYHARKALSNSGIPKILESAAKFKAWLDGQTDKRTEACLLGSVFHTLALEPEWAADRYLVPAFDGRTKAGQEERRAAIEEGREVVKADDMNTACAMAIAARDHKRLGRLLKDPTARKEVSIFWTEEISGMAVPCKARLDCMVDVPNYGLVVLDLKSTISAAPVRFSRTIYERGYHRQGWWYQRALYQAGLTPRTFVIGAVEKEPPYLVATYELEPRAVELGGRDCLAALQLYADCIKSGLWPGYSDDILPIDLDDWVYRKEFPDDQQLQLAE